MRVEHDDILAKFRNPLILFNSKYRLGDSTYIESLRKWFEEATGTTTLYLPLRNKSFDLVIRDDEFRRFYEEKVLPNERIFYNPNFKRTFCKDFIVATEDDRLNFYIMKQMIKSSNQILSKTNYVLFFNNIVNLLVFWYGLSVIETLILTVKAISVQVYRREMNLMKRVRGFVQNRLAWCRRRRANSVHSLNGTLAIFQAERDRFTYNLNFFRNPDI